MPHSEHGTEYYWHGHVECSCKWVVCNSNVLRHKATKISRVCF